MNDPTSGPIRAPPVVTYELALSILFHILIEEREKLSLDQELVSCTHSKIMWLSCGAIHIMTYVLKVNTIGEVVLELGAISYC
jgi:hypothetical protein